MTKRRQTRFSAEEEILKRIDATRLLITAKNCEATDCEKRARIAVRQMAELEEETIAATGKHSDKLWQKAKEKKAEFNHLRDQAMKARKKAISLEENTLPKLKNTLAAFNTTPMPDVCGADVSVVLGQ